MCCCSPTGRRPVVWAGFARVFVESVILAALGLKRGEAQDYRVGRTIINPDDYVDLSLVEGSAHRVRAFEIVEKSVGLRVHCLVESGKRLKPERLSKPASRASLLVKISSEVNLEGVDIVLSPAGRRVAWCSLVTVGLA